MLGFVAATNGRDAAFFKTARDRSEFSQTTTEKPRFPAQWRDRTPFQFIVRHHITVTTNGSHWYPLDDPAVSVSATVITIDYRVSVNEAAGLVSRWVAQTDPQAWAAFAKAYDREYPSAPAPYTGPVMTALTPEELAQSRKAWEDHQKEAEESVKDAAYWARLRITLYPDLPVRADDAAAMEQARRLYAVENAAAWEQLSPGEKLMAIALQQMLWALAGAAVGEFVQAAIDTPELKVWAEGKADGHTFYDTNQGARVAGDAESPTLIADRIAAKVTKQPGKEFPNGNMATAHAEIGLIQQAKVTGVIEGQDMVMTVEGEPVCGYCRGDVAAAAEKAGLKSLTINEVETGKTLYWKPGMRSLKEVK